MTAGIVASRDPPAVRRKRRTGGPRALPVDRLRLPGVQSARRIPPFLDAILARLRADASSPVTVLRLGVVGLFALAGGPWLAWLPLDLLERMPGMPVRPLSISHC